ncbi:MAG: MGMT family protein [Candidatus Omnitrophota bacterium]
MNKHLSTFENKVYKIVKTIPRGEVRSYQWVAKRIGRPKAYRAVGNALNKNPCPQLSCQRGRRAWPVVVPCHRVVKSDGTLGGFAKGPKEKLRLLRAEGLTPEKIRDIITKKEKHAA